MGSRGASSGGATGGAGGNILGTESLVSARESKQREVDDVLTVARDIYDEYGIIATDLQIATMDKKGQSTMAYYDNEGNLAINESYFDSKKMDSAYDACVKAGFHPPRGNKSGIEATTAHEMGHRLTDELGKKMGHGDFAIDQASSKIIAEAKKRLGAKSVDSIRKKISGYAKQNNAEAVAEAFADVYCNGNKASRESRAVVSALNDMLKN